LAQVAIGELRILPGFPLPIFTKKETKEKGEKERN
jgi:hypothetical protein